MTDQPMLDTPVSARLRSGTAARLAGVPVATLRVWERRYGVVAAPKTPTGQRLYSGHDVQRLRLIKQLSDRGHAIGTIAALPLAELVGLDTLAQATPRPAQGAAAVRRRVVVVGRATAQKVGAVPGCELLAVHDDLAQAEAALPGAEAPDVLLAHLSSLQLDAVERVQALAMRLQAPLLVVVYAFGAEALAESLRAGGASVRREPVSARELGRLVGAAPPVPVASTVPAAEPRRFTDESLTRIAALPTQVACECPRHIAELVMQLAAFERYSAECSSQTPADAALHRRLTGLAGVARTLFEQTLVQVITDEGLVLSDWVTTPAPST